MTSHRARTSVALFCVLAGCVVGCDGARGNSQDAEGETGGADAAAPDGGASVDAALDVRAVDATPDGGAVDGERPDGGALDAKSADGSDGGPGSLCPGCFFDSEFDAPLSWTGVKNSEGWTGWHGPCAVAGAPTQCMTIESAIVHSGSGALNMRFACVGLACNPGGGGNMISRRHPDTPHVFGRMMFRVGPGYRLGDNLHSKILFHEGGAASPGWPLPIVDLAFGAIGQYTLDLQASYDDDVKPTQMVSTVAPSTTSWDLVEWEMAINSVSGVVANKDGYVRMWVNGALIIESLNRALVGPTNTSKDPRYGNPTPANYTFGDMKLFNQSGFGDMYIDRLAAGAVRIGPPK